MFGLFPKVVSSKPDLPRENCVIQSIYRHIKRLADKLIQSTNIRKTREKIVKLFNNLDLFSNWYFQTGGGVSENVLHSFCWMYSTFNVPLDFKGVCSKRKSLDVSDPLYNSYYQWVPLYLVKLNSVSLINKNTEVVCISIFAAILVVSLYLQVVCNWILILVIWIP